MARTISAPSQTALSVFGGVNIDICVIISRVTDQDDSHMSTAFDLLETETLRLKEIYVDKNKKSAEAFENNKKSGVAGGTNRASIHWKPFPLTFVDAHGAEATTADGQVVTDFLGNYTAGLFGFSPEPVQRAVSHAMERGHALGGAANLEESKVAGYFTERFPSMDLIRFSNTGTEANSYAIHTARAVTGKNKILMYDGAYHGAWIHGSYNEAALDTPYQKIIVPYGDIDQIMRAMDENAQDLAAVIIEPVMVNPMVYLKRVAPRAYLQKIRDKCSEIGCALIIDEVMTSRLSPGGAQELVGVEADITTVGKYFGGGFPFGAFGGKEYWMNRHDPSHPETINSGGTFNQNALCLAATRSVLEELWSPDKCVEHNSRGDRFRNKINDLSKKHGMPCQACGTGSLITLIWQNQDVTGEVDEDSASHQLNFVPNKAVFKATELFWFYMMVRHDVLAGSPKLNYLTLPTPLQQVDYDKFLVGMEEFFLTFKNVLKVLASET